MAEIDEVLSPPPENDTFRFGIDTTTAADITANKRLIESFGADFTADIRATIELEIVYENGMIGCHLLNPGMAPFEGALLPAEDIGGGSNIAVDHTHDRLPNPIIEPKRFRIKISEDPPDDHFIVEITEAESEPVIGKVTNKSIENHSIDPRVVAFEDTEIDLEKIHIYFCGVYDDDKKSTCQECFNHELFGSQDETTASAGDTILLKDFKRSFNNDSDSVLYGPYTAVENENKTKDSDAFDGRFPYQVEVKSDELFMLPLKQLDVDIGSHQTIEGETAKDVLSQLLEDGTPIEIGSDGEIEDIDPEPNEPGKFDEGKDAPGGDPPEPKNPVEPITTIHLAKEQSDPLPAKEALEEASNPGTQLLQPAIDGELRPKLYERALSHLVAGKNLILYGPPGSGKTRIAERLGHVVCSQLHIEAANAEWTYQEVVGGYTPDKNGGFKPTRGVLTSAAAACETSLTEWGHPDWLLIDELNRANLDEAFGDVFTLLDLDHRTDSKITFAGTHTQAVPLGFRILGTMNTEDQAQLFSLGYAFRRRFAFIEVPPVFDSVTQDTEPSASRGDLDLEPEFQRLLSVLEQAAVSHFDQSGSTESLCNAGSDTTVGIPPLEVVIDAEEMYDAAVDTVSPTGASIEFPTAILWFTQTLAQNDVAEIGQGILIDTIRYVLSHYVLFPTKTDWRVVDHAVTAYILPQLESYTSELRRAETVATESDAVANFETVITAAQEIGFISTADSLKTALDSHEILR